MARLLDGLEGRSKEILLRLLETRQNGYLPNTLLLTGPEAAVGARAAQALAQALLCTEDPSGCGHCPSCRRVELRQSESLRWLAPEKNLIKIEQAREILDFLSLRTLSKARVVVVESAECLNPQAANALLKILEEPPAETFFILITRSPKHVLPTVRSRAVHIPFPPRSPLESLSEEEKEERQLALEMLEWWLESPQAYLRPSFRERVKDRVLAQRLAWHFQSVFHDLRLIQLGIRGADQPLMSRAAAELPRVDELFQLALGLEREMGGGSRDPLLAFEEFWIRGHALV